jgi:antitoxin (DNA-binding transcriptional repressor) of toxin-antitoxin stability system
VGALTLPASGSRQSDLHQQMQLASNENDMSMGILIMKAMPLELAEGHLTEIIERLSPGEEVVLTRDDKPIATIRNTAHEIKMPRFGTLKGTILHIAPDFDEIPEGFEDYAQ